MKTLFNNLISIKNNLNKASVVKNNDNRASFFGEDGI